MCRRKNKPPALQGDRGVSRAPRQAADDPGKLGLRNDAVFLSNPGYAAVYRRGDMFLT